MNSSYPAAAIKNINTHWTPCRCKQNNTQDVDDFHPAQITLRRIIGCDDIIKRLKKQDTFRVQQAEKEAVCHHHNFSHCMRVRDKFHKNEQRRANMPAAAVGNLAIRCRMWYV